MPNTNTAYIMTIDLVITEIELRIRNLSHLISTENDYEVRTALRHTRSTLLDLLNFINSSN